jgi:hypothetical protein
LEVAHRPPVSLPHVAGKKILRLVEIAVATALVVGVAVFWPRAVSAPAASASPTATLAAATTAAPTLQPPTPTATARTFTGSLGYTVQLPPGYRRSDLQSFASPRPDGDPNGLTQDLFTYRDPASEADAIRRSDTGVEPAQTYTAHVGVFRNSRGLSATAYAESVKNAYGFFVVSLEPTPVDGRAGARLNFRYTRDHPKAFYALFVAEGDRMWTIGYFPGITDPAPPGASDDAARSIVESFRFRP